MYFWIGIATSIERRISIVSCIRGGSFRGISGSKCLSKTRNKNYGALSVMYTELFFLEENITFIKDENLREYIAYLKLSGNNLKVKTRMIIIIESAIHFLYNK